MNEQTVITFEDAWLPLPDGEPLKTETGIDSLTIEAVMPFDLTWDGSVSFTPAKVPAQMPTDFGIGVIVGASGSGKSTLLRDFSDPEPPKWDSRPIAAHFASALEVGERFYAVGLNAVPTWTKPYAVLSTGERFRADLARQLSDGAVIDEYTSVVDRTVATSVSKALARHVAQKGLRRIVLATCHRDVLPWLQPDWVIDLDIRCWALRPRECLQRDEPVVEIREATRDAWAVFHQHHYLSGNLHPFARCFIATMDGHLAAFSAVMPFPNGHLKNAWREHRTVVLPDFQGLGIGMHLSDWVGAFMLAQGKRYYSRTAHPRMGAYRNASPLWRATSGSGKRAKRIDNPKRRYGHWDFDDKRVGWSHEFVGGAS